MQWDIIGKVRAQIVWSGTSFSGSGGCLCEPLGGITDERGSVHFRSFAIAALRDTGDVDFTAGTGLGGAPVAVFSRVASVCV